MAKIWNGRPVYNRYFTDFTALSTGLIPTEIGQLINLTGLDLGHNKLTGRWPKYEMVDQVTTGILLILWHHRTGLFPTEIGQLINLKKLNLNRNELTGRWPTYEMVDRIITCILPIIWQRIRVEFVLAYSGFHFSSIIFNNLVESLKNKNNYLICFSRYKLWNN